MFDRDVMLNRLPRSAGWYQISNADESDGVAHIRIYETIGGWFGATAKEFVDELDQIAAAEIVVSINCKGGDVFDGIAIYNALRMHPAKVTTQVDSLAASIASVIAQAGDTRQMVSHSQMMIHTAWGLMIGTAAEARAYADLLDRQSDNIANIYADRAGKPAAGFIELMQAETWLSDEEAVDKGLADEIIQPQSHSDTDTGDTSAVTRRFSEHIAAVLTDVDELTDRIDGVVTLRTDQGKPVDDTWRTRDSIDRLAACITRLQDQFEETPPTTTSQNEAAEAEFLRFVDVTQGV